MYDFMLTQPMHQDSMPSSSRNEVELNDLTSQSFEGINK